MVVYVECRSTLVSVHCWFGVFYLQVYYYASGDLFIYAAWSNFGGPSKCNTKLTVFFWEQKTNNFGGWSFAVWQTLFMKNPASIVLSLLSLRRFGEGTMHIILCALSAVCEILCYSACNHLSVFLP